MSKKQAVGILVLQALVGALGKDSLTPDQWKLACLLAGTGCVYILVQGILDYLNGRKES